MKKLLAAAAMIAVAMGPAWSQGQKGSGPNTQLEQIDEAHKRENKDIDSAYNRALKGTRSNAAKPYDPWGQVRPSTLAPAKN
jgi:hypothetical protein